MAKSSITSISKIEMKKIITFCALTLLFANGARAQKYSEEISTDSLLRMFRRDSPFKVLREFRSENFSDYKGAYNNEELKSYLLKWLSKEEYRTYQINQDIKELTNNTDFIKRLIRFKLVDQNHEAWSDSIIQTPALYEKYRDSVLIEESNRYKKSTKLETSYPPEKAIWFHSQVAYPESYVIIRQWWIEMGKPVLVKNFTSFDNYFLALVKMRDPEAIQLANREVKKFLQSKGQSADPMDFVRFIGQNKNPYGVEKILELLPVAVKFLTISDEPMEQFNCIAIGMLSERLYLNAIPINAPVKRNSTCEEQLKHVAAFKEAAQKLIKKYQEDEKYWMDNMPYRKK